MKEDLDEWTATLERASRTYATPFYLLRQSVYVRRLERLRTQLAAQLRGYGLKQWYSYKTLPIPHFAFIANKICAVGIEITSDFELQAVLAAGISAQDILVNGPCKHLWLPRDLRRLNVAFDSLHETQELASASVALDWTVGLRLFLSTQRDPDDERYPAQFGMTAEQFRLAFEILTKCGKRPTFVHFHLRANVALDTLKSAASEAAEIINSLDDPSCIRVVNFGGGLPEPNVWINGREPASEISFSDYGKTVAFCRALFPKADEVWLENGRSLVGPAGALVLTVGDIKQIEDYNVLICDGGRTNHALESDWGSHIVRALDVGTHEPMTPTIVCGPSCMPYDWIYRGELPRVTKRGTKIAYFNAGAYHIPWETRFSRGLSPVILEDLSGTLSCIRQRESIESWVGSWISHGT